MERKYVLSAVGPDQPGIVDRLAGFLSDEGFNLEDSRMAVLGGEFALILLVTATSEAAKDLGALAPRIESLTGLSVTVKATAAPSRGHAGVPFIVRGYAMDHPGIVHALAHEVAELGANIEEMETVARPAPVSGTPLFDVRMRISLPAGVPVQTLRRRLSEVAEARNMDISVEPSPI
ncbi:MAG: glycine cleavage system protein R [Candidatus Omnitrophica bacterium]|nr:glycine cleavage system protein R [Candidatus Omnitrophota bacterium]